jgi:hypothetical protein
MEMASYMGGKLDLEKGWEDGDGELYEKEARFGDGMGGWRWRVGDLRR